CRGLTLGGTLESFAFSRDRILEGLERQLRPAIEVPVETALLHSGDAHDLRHRGAAVAVGVEETRRLGHDAPSRGFAFSHRQKRPIGRLLSRVSHLGTWCKRVAGVAVYPDGSGPG